MICPKCQQEKGQLEKLIALQVGNQVKIFEAASPICKGCLLKGFKFLPRKKKEIRREWY